nr:unnamed protein product [Spirometra erinaceieuropaei]
MCVSGLATIVAAIDRQNRAGEKGDWSGCYMAFGNHTDLACLRTLTATQLDKALDAGLSEETPLAQLCSELENLLKPSIPKREALDRMYSRRRLIGESAKDFADDLYCLCKAAFPSISPADCNDAVLYHFIKYIEPSELRRSLLLQPPHDLQDAISRVNHYSTLPQPDLPRRSFLRNNQAQNWRRDDAGNHNRPGPFNRFQYPRHGDYNRFGNRQVCACHSHRSNPSNELAGSVPGLAWDILLGLDFLSRYNCAIQVNQRTIEFQRPHSTTQAVSPTFDEDAVCAAIQATVALPTVHIDTMLPDTVNVTENDRETLRVILTEFTEVFAWDDDSLGRTANLRHYIDTGNAKPVWQPPRRIPAHFPDKVSQLIDFMLKNRVIRPSNSPWASPVTLVPKKDGKLRLCVDYRRLNALTTRDSFPLPRIDVTLDALAGARWFSTLNLKSGVGIWKTRFPEEVHDIIFLESPFSETACRTPQHRPQRTYCGNLLEMKEELFFPQNISKNEKSQFVRQADPRLRVILFVRLLLLVGFIFVLLCLFNCPLLWFFTSRSFSIDIEKGTFLKDGAPFRYVSGSLHYFRIPKIYWMDRLLKAKAAGLNVIQIYIPWNFHEPTPGEYIFYGDRDVVEFISMAHEVGLLVLVRAGPYICAEWDFGGLPAWLLSVNPNMKLRSFDPEFLGPVIRWFQQLFPRLHPYLYENGGPIIMVQLENEYGSYVTCDQDYLSTLYEFARYQLGPNVILYTTDGPSMTDLKCGSSDRRLFTTIDFNVAQALLPNETFSDLEKFQPNHPLVNSEFYTGWFDIWGQGRHTTPAEQLVAATETLWNYSERVSLNYYMFHGGTNFGFWNGGRSGSDAAITTSYDYDAPISEAGDVTTKYMMLRDLLFKLRKETPPPLPSNITKKAYGTVPVRPFSHLLYKLTGGTEASRPATMESCGQYQGFMTYSTSIERLLPGSSAAATLRLPLIKDVGHVFTTTPSGDDFASLLYFHFHASCPVLLSLMDSITYF